MKKFYFLLVFALFFAGCVENEKNGLGQLCSPTQCDAYCRENAIQCEEYCIANPLNKMCRERFSFVYEENYVPLTQQKQANYIENTAPKIYEQTNATPQIQTTNETAAEVQEVNQSNREVSSGVVKNLGILFAPWDRNTNRAGAFIFKENEQKLFLEFGAKVMGADGKLKILPTFEYRTSPDAEVYAITDGIIASVNFKEYSQDYEIIIIPSVDSTLRVYQDHVKAVNVTAGSKVKAGDVLGIVGNAGEVGRTEINIGRGGNPPIGYCPFEYFDSSLKEEYRQKVSQFMTEWEEFKNNQSIYDEANQVFTGCNYKALSEDVQTGEQHVVE